MLKDVRLPRRRVEVKSDVHRSQYRKDSVSAASGVWNERTLTTRTPSPNMDFEGKSIFHPNQEVAGSFSTGSWQAEAVATVLRQRAAFSGRLADS